MAEMGKEVSTDTVPTTPVFSDQNNLSCRPSQAKQAKQASLSSTLPSSTPKGMTHSYATVVTQKEKYVLNQKEITNKNLAACDRPLPVTVRTVPNGKGSDVQYIFDTAGLLRTFKDTFSR